MEEFEFSRDFFGAFKAAKSKNNIQEMDMVFQQLAHEVGLSDPESNASQAAAGKLIAELMNNKGKGPDCKKLI